MNPNTLKKIQRLKNGESFVTSEPGNSMLPLYKSNEKHLCYSYNLARVQCLEMWFFCKVRGFVFLPTRYTQ